MVSAAKTEHKRALALGFHAASNRSLASCTSADAADRSARGLLRSLPSGGGDAYALQRLPARRYVYCARAEHAPDLIVKVRAGEVDLGIENEAWALARLSSMGDGEPGLPRVPALVAVCASHAAIAVERLDGCVPLRDWLNAASVEAVNDLLRGFAAQLARLHSDTCVDPEAPDDPYRVLELGLTPADTLTLDEFVLGVGSDFHEYVRSLQRVAPAVAQARLEWTGQTLIHFDLHFENLLCIEEQGNPVVGVVDWELAGFGDPAWDVATICCQLLERGLARGLRRPSAVLAQRDWQSAVDRVAAFIAAYAETVTPRGLLHMDRVRRYTGLQTLLLAQGKLLRAGRLDTLARACLRLGTGIVDGSGAELFGAAPARPVGR